MHSIEIVQQLLMELAALRAAVPNADMLIAARSGWSVGEHISHVAIAAPYVISQVRGPSSSDPNLAPAGPEFMSMLARASIPRGPVQPPARERHPRSDQPHLIEDLDRAVQCVSALLPDMPAVLADPGLVRHPNPAFGGLTRMQWLHAMSIHQRHHQLIIADILRHA